MTEDNAGGQGAEIQERVPKNERGLSLLRGLSFVFSSLGAIPHDSCLKGTPEMSKPKAPKGPKLTSSKSWTLCWGLMAWLPSGAAASATSILLHTFCYCAFA